MTVAPLRRYLQHWLSSSQPDPICRAPMWMAFIVPPRPPIPDSDDAGAAIALFVAVAPKCQPERSESGGERLSGDAGRKPTKPWMFGSIRKPVNGAVKLI